MRALFLDTRPLNGLAPLIRLAKSGHQVDLATENWSNLKRLNPQVSQHFEESVGLIKLPDGSLNDIIRFQQVLCETGRTLSSYDAVLTLNDEAVESASRIAELAGLTHATPVAVTNAKDKQRTRKLLTDAGLRQPGYRVAHSLEEAFEGATELGFPVILKPTRLSAARGVSLATNKAQLEASYHNARSIMAATGCSLDPVLVETYIDGPQVSAEVLSRGKEHIIMGFTDRLPTVDSMAERGGVFPARLPLELEAKSATIEALDAIGFTDAASHVEIRFSDSGPVVIEINPRLAGFVVPDLIEAATGLNPYDAIVRLHSGLPVSFAQSSERFAALRPVFADRNGVIGSVDVTLAEAMPEVTNVFMFRSAGDVAQVANDNWDRLGAVIAIGKSPEAASRAAEKACALIKIDYEELPSAER